MPLIDHAATPAETWRPGVVTRMRVSALNGAAQLTVFEQWCEPGKGAPTHVHAVEEVLSVLSGSAEIWIDGVAAPVAAGQSMLIPAGRAHGFRNTGAAVLHVMAILAAPMFEASFEDSNEVSRRWMPGR